MAVQGGELCTKGSCHTFVLSSCHIECVSVGDGPSGRVVGHSRVGEALLHIVEGYPFHGGLLRRVQAVPNGCQVPKVGGGGASLEVGKARGSGEETQSRGAASPRTGTGPKVRGRHRREVQEQMGSRRGG